MLVGWFGPTGRPLRGYGHPFSYFSVLELTITITITIILLKMQQTCVDKSSATQKWKDTKYQIKKYND